MHFVGMSGAHRVVDKVLSLETSAPLLWHEADLIKRRESEQSSERKEEI